MSDYKKLMGALLIGAAAGSILGVLFAPDKGSATRKKISKKASDVIDQLSDKIEEAKESLADLSKKAKDIKGDVKEKVSEAKEEFHNATRKSSTNAH